MSVTIRDAYLEQKIRERVRAAVDAPVRIYTNEWDDGYCETCSWPEQGVIIEVDGEQVWPDPSFYWIDRRGDTDLTHILDTGPQAWTGVFFDWLSGKTVEEVEAE